MNYSRDPKTIESNAS